MTATITIKQGVGITHVKAKSCRNLEVVSLRVSWEIPRIIMEWKKQNLEAGTKSYTISAYRIGNKFKENGQNP